MGHIYYAIGILIFIGSLFTLIRFNKVFSVKEWYFKFKEITDKEPTILDFRKKGDKKIFVNHNFLLLFEIIWITLGLITNSWYIFLSILIINIILNIIFRKNRFSLIGKISSFGFLLLRISTYLFLIINHFHLHIDLLEIISKSF